MQLPYSWIKELVEISWPPKELASRLTLCGTAADISKFIEKEYDNIIVGQISSLELIEGSDHLKTAVVNTGAETVQVVCGAPNVQSGQKVIFARVGAVLKTVGEVKKVKLRGVESYGMICSEAELGLTDDHSGIIVLEDEAPPGTPIADYMGLNDHLLKFDLTPNRADSMSVVGVARDVACLAGKPIRREKYILEECSRPAADEVKVSIDDSEACPRYAARIIKGVKIGPSPWWIKRKLLLCGIRPISNVVDITNLVMMELGHPLHAFDFKRFSRKEVLVRRARRGEKFATLDGKEHELTNDVLLITDGEKAVAAAGVMGGLESEVSEDTTDLLLESAYFDPVTIRKSRIRLGMTSESSSRFEKGADPNIVPEAINRAAYLIAKYAGGEIYQGIVDCYPKKIVPRVVGLRPTRANAILGTNIQPQRMIAILRGLEFDVEEMDELKVTVPTFRPDISREIDLIEEVARIEGYEAIPTVDRNIGPLFTVQHTDDLFRETMRTVLTSQGLDEIYGSGLADPKMMARLTGGKADVRILNPIAEDLSVLQNTLNYSLLTAVSHNFAFRNTDIRLFELGRSFVPRDKPAAGAAAPQESEQIGIALSGRSNDEWFEKGRDHDFYEMKGIIDALLEASHTPPAGYQPVSTLPYTDGFTFSVQLAGRPVGEVGLVQAELTRLFDIKQAVYTAVLDFNMLLEARLPEKEYELLPKFPAAPRDMAIVVDESVRVGDLIDEIKSAGGPLLETVKLFDLYRGKQIGEGKKSLAFAMMYRSSEGSLESEQVIEIHNKIADHLRERFKAEVREG